MTKQACYTPEKFKSFTPNEQHKAIHKLSCALELSLNDTFERKRLISHILELSSLAEQPLDGDTAQFLDCLAPDISPYTVLQKLNDFHGAALRKDNQLSIRTGDGNPLPNPLAKQKASGITLICDNLRSVFNVGSIFRSAECLGIGEILLCGITPLPTHPNLPKTAMGTESLVAWRHFDHTSEAIMSCKQQGMHIYALETVQGAQSVFSAVYNYPMALVLGNESLGINPEHLALCDSFISLPQLGWKNSLNVGVATACTLYQIIFGDQHE